LVGAEGAAENVPRPALRLVAIVLLAHLHGTLRTQHTPRVRVARDLRDPSALRN